MSEIAQTLHKLDAYCLAQDFAGWDPFDALNSKLFQASQMHRSAFLRLCWLQAFKRLPLNLRPLTTTPKTTNAKAISLFLRSAIVANDEPRMKQLHARMMAARVPPEDWGEAAWGYPFDWQAKAFFVSQDTPNVICTAYAIRALRALQAVRPDWVDSSHFVEAAHFVQKHLRQSEGYIAYVPDSSALVYNASLWGVWVCLQGYAENGDESLKETAEGAIANALAAQREDGAWIYGTASHHGFIDGFHTGYNLEALHLMNQQLKRDDIALAIAKGLAFYLEHCFEPNGLAKYYANERYPIDPHSAAQGVITLLSIDEAAYRSKAEKIAQAMIAEMWDERRGYFYYQKHAAYTNRIPYMRWTQAWMHLALNLLVR